MQHEADDAERVKQEAKYDAMDTKERADSAE